MKNGWTAEKDGLVVVYRKGNLKVVWDLGERKYEIRRAEGDTERVVEQGVSQHLDVETFLYYVEEVWSNNPKNE